MKAEKIIIRENEPDIYMKSYIHDDSTGAHAGKRPAMLVLPGGAYAFLADGREGEPVALKYFAAGFNTFMLMYSVGERAVYPRPIVEVSRAIVTIRRRAEELNIDTDRVFVAGFSAGGHLSAAIGSFWHCPWAASGEDMKPGENRPRAVITSYPVISSGKFAHRDSFYNILGSREPDAEMLARYSIEKNISDKTVPTFIWHTASDDCVPVENSLIYAMALSESKIPFELHIYPGGRHGLATADSETDCGVPEMNDAHIARWFDESLLFLKKYGS